MLNQPLLLSAEQAGIQAAVAWLHQLFPDPEELAAVIDRGPTLLLRSTEHLRDNADTLQLAFGWHEGDGQLAASIDAYPQPFSIVCFRGEVTAYKLLFLTQVVGISADKCLTTNSSYLKTSLETMSAHYMLVQASRLPASCCCDGCRRGLMHASCKPHVMPLLPSPFSRRALPRSCGTGPVTFASGGSALPKAKTTSKAWA